MELLLGSVGILITVLVAIFTGIFRMLHNQVTRISHLEGRFDLLYDDKRFMMKLQEIKQNFELEIQTLSDKITQDLQQRHTDLAAQTENHHAHHTEIFEQQIANIQQLLENIEQQLATFQAQLSTAQTQLLHDKRLILEELQHAREQLLAEIKTLPVQNLVSDVHQLKLQLVQLPKKRQIWWSRLHPTWQSIFKKSIGITAEPYDRDLVNILALHVLDCKGNKLNDLEPLRALTQLYSLNCASNQLSTLEPLQALTQLRILNCSSNQLTSLEPLRDLTQLQSLNCENNQFASLESLNRLNQLQKLECDGNQITSLVPLHSLKDLKELLLATSWLNRHNPLAPEEIERFKQVMPQCKVEI